MTNNIKRLASGFSALVLTLGSVAIAPAAYATVLEENLTLTEDVAECYTISSGQNVTLNLGEYDITCGGDNAITVENGATLTINGSGAVTTATRGKAAIYNKVGGTVIINGGAFNSENWYTIKNLGSMTIVDGSFSQGVSNTSNASLVANGWYNGASATGASDQGNPYTGTVATMTINGGTFTHYTTTSTIKSDDYSKTIINGGTFNSANGFLVQTTGDVAITDGSFTGYSALLTYNADGSEDYEPGTAVISGGNVSATYMADADSDYSSLRVEGGVFTGLTDFLMCGELTSGEVTGGTFNINPHEYIVEGSWSYYNDETDSFVVAEAPVINGLQSNYNVRAGQQVELDYTLTPEIAGNWIDVYSMEENDLCGESETSMNCINFNAETKTLSVDPATTVGVHHMECSLADSTKGNFTLTVLPRGELSVESKTVHVNTAGEIPTYTWAELGVDAEGDGITGESKNGGVWVDVENKTVEVYDDDEVTWSYDGEVKGKTTFVTYYVYDYSESTVYGVKVGNKTSMSTSYDGVTVEIEDKTIADFVTEKSTYYSDGKEYTYEGLLIHGLKSGTTYVKFVAPNGETVKRTLLEVFDYKTTLQHAQAVGTSQTFTITPDKGYKVKELYVSAAGMWDDEGNEVADAPVEYTVNKDGSYTIKVKKMPTYMDCVREDEYECALNEKGEETTVEKISPMLWVDVEIVDAAGNTFYENDSVVLFEFDVKDEVSEEVDGEEAAAASNEKALAGYTAEIISIIFNDEEIRNSEKPVVIELSDGKTYAVIDDAKGFAEAILNGEEIVTTLTAPEEIKEVDATEEKALKEELAKASETAEGFRFVNIEVLLTSGDKTFGRITEMDEALKLTIDVSDDEPVAEGMVRRYYVVRYHDGVATNLEAEYDEENKIVTTESDRFSTYLIAYTDTPEIPKAPDTGIVKD